MNSIQMINENKFTLESRGAFFTLMRESYYWIMYRDTERNMHCNSVGYKTFDDLKAVEKQYKCWRGVSQLVEGL